MARFVLPGNASDLSRDGSPAMGVLYALSAYLAWGLLPLYWKALHGVPLLEVVAHRMLWAAVVALIWLTAQRRLKELLTVFVQWRFLGVRMLTGGLLIANWLVYIWAIENNQVLQSSLGYFMTPLMNVLLATVLLREKLRIKQWVAVGLAGLGVLNFAWQLDGVPWIALVLSVTFSIYGLLRKTMPSRPLVGLGAELIALSPFAIVFLGHVQSQGHGAFGHSRHVDVLLVLTGLITVLPLWWFTIGAKRLRYSTIGVFQYLAPTCQFFLATLVFNEPFDVARLITFAFIWIGLIIFAIDTRSGYMQSVRRDKT